MNQDKLKALAQEAVKRIKTTTVLMPTSPQISCYLAWCR